MRIAAVLLSVAIPDRPMAWCAGLAALMAHHWLFMIKKSI
jgi:hypothetical protein